MSGELPPVLRFDRIRKGFPGVQALADVSFAVNGSSIHALCGENGAGKSTLLKVLSGAYRPDSGSLILQEKQQLFSSPDAAIRAGVAVIYQELHLVPEMTVAENVFLGHLPHTGGMVQQKELNTRTRTLLEQVGIGIDPGTRVSRLPLAMRQMVEITKALSRQAQVLAFDEPTSSLSSREVEALFQLIRTLKTQGKAILYVSHRMDEIFDLCDAGTVLRDGRHVETFYTLGGTTPSALVARMVGRELVDIYGYRERPLGDIVLQADRLTAPGLSAPVSLQVRSGEIVGLFGLIGSGRTELLKALFGAQQRSGTVTVQGVPLVSNSPSASIQAGLALIPEDRKKEGIIRMRSVAENINLSVRSRFSPFGLLVPQRERANAENQVRAMQVKTPSPAQPIGMLSGGNQQKAILGRWLSQDRKALLLDEPTRGIDIGAKREIYDIIYAQAKRGVGVLLVSSELPEVLGVCDRVLVLRQGEIVADLSRSEMSPERCLQFALPVTGGATR